MATVAATGGSREARRRRIIERGADRLALITGRIQSLPSDRDQSLLSTTPPAQIPADVVKHENVASDSPPLPNLEELSQRHTVTEEKESSPENSEKSKTIMSRSVAAAPIVEREEKSEISKEQSQLSSSTQRTQVDQSGPSPMFTACHISFAIAASENIRMYFSVAAAILVTLLSVKFPILGGCIIRNVIIFKPLYMLLLSNISIVLAWCILGKQGSGLRTGQVSSVPKLSGNDMVDRLGKALEMALLMQKIFEAMVMDFGIYAAVLVCCLSLLQTLGW